MILYFSGTGNSRWIACELARATGDEAIDVIDVGRMLDRTGDAAPDSDATPALDLSGESRIGIVFPIYSWGIPEPMITFLKQTSIPESAFVYGVCTCGSEAGLAMDDLAELVPLDSAYSIAMPNNYIIAADVEPLDVARAKIDDARKAVSAIAAEVLERHATRRVNVGSLPFLKSRLANKGFNQFARSTKPFSVTNACIGCGLCARRCPSRSIEMRNGRPAWTSATCFQCLRCINECPQAAIQHGKATEGRGRYSLDRLLKSLDTR